MAARKFLQNFLITLSKSIYCNQVESKCDKTTAGKDWKMFLALLQCLLNIFYIIEIVYLKPEYTTQLSRVRESSTVLHC